MAEYQPNISRVQPAASTKTRLKAGRDLAAEGRLDDALREFEAVIRMDANSKQGNLAAGVVCLSLKRYDEARTYFEKVIRIDPMKPRAYLMASRVGLAQGDYGRAMTHALDAIRLNPKSFVAYLALGQVHYKQKELDKAREEFDKAVSLNPRSLPARLSLAAVDVAQGNSEGAVASLMAALRIEPERAQTYENLGRVQLLRKEYEPARGAFEKALQLKPDIGTNAQLGLAESCIECGQIGAAEAVLREVKKRDQFKAMLHKLWGDIYHSRRQYPVAVEEYRAAELMLAEEDKDSELEIAKLPSLAEDDPQWESMSEDYRTKTREAIESRRIKKLQMVDVDSAGNDIDDPAEL